MFGSGHGRSGQHAEPLDRQTAEDPYYVCGGCGISVREIHSLVAPAALPGGQAGASAPAGRPAAARLMGVQGIRLERTGTIDLLDVPEAVQSLAGSL